MIRKSILITVLLLFAVSASAQLTDMAKIKKYRRDNSFGVRGAASPFSLIDFSRVKWSNSYSVSFFSGGQSSGSLGMFNSSMMYDISTKLSLAVNLGVLHSPSSLWGNRDGSATFLPGFILDFHPSEHFNLRINYQRLGSYNPQFLRSGSRQYYFDPH